MELAQRRAERLQLLQEAGQQLASSMDEAEIVRRLAQQVERLVACDGVMIVLSHPEGYRRPVACRIRGSETYPRPNAQCERLVDAVQASGTPVCLDTSSGPTGDDATGASLLGVPALSGATLIAVIAAWSDQPNAFTTEDQEVLVTVGAHAATALSNARLYAESQRERRRSEALSDIARAVSSSLRLGDVTDLILRHAVALLRARGATLSLLRDDALHVVAGMGAGHLLIGAVLPLDGSVSGRVLRLRTWQIVNDTDRDPEAFRPTKHAADVRKVLSVPLFTSDGPVGVLSVINRSTDFTDEDALVLQRLADQVAVAVVNARLFEAEERYSRLVEAASDAIFTIDGAERVTSVNRAMCVALGLERERLLGLSLAELIDPRDRGAALELAREALGGKRKRGNFRYTAASGDTRSCSLIVVPLIEGGEVAGALGIVRDVTDEKRLTEQLMQQEKLAAVGQLVSGVAHELNNPLAGVMAFAQLLLASPTTDDEQRRAIEAIYEESKRAAKIVSNLLTFARQHQPERAITDLNRVVSDTLELRRYAMSVDQIEIERHLDPTLPLTWADPFQLQQVVLNLIGNAEHALTDWPGDKRVILETRQSGDMLEIVVADTGPGIPNVDIPRIFNPFFTTKPTGQGTGLGLSISDGIVREHGGRIRVESRAGAGATFVVELPRIEPPHTLPRRFPAETRASARAKLPQRVLIVDDEEAIRTSVVRYLGSLGHEAHAVSSGREALERIRHTSYDAMVIDLRMPEMSGDALFARVLVQAPALAHRVVFLTGDTQSASARALLDETGRPSLRKPFLLDELAAMLLAAIGETTSV
jgi:two-component system, NtrC family, sensor kinase